MLPKLQEDVISTIKNYTPTSLMYIILKILNKILAKQNSLCIKRIIPQLNGMYFSYVRLVQILKSVNVIHNFNRLRKKIT